MFIIIYEAKRPKEARELRAKAQTYSTIEAAEAAQRQVAHDFRCGAWVAEVPDPPLLEPVKEGGTVSVPGGVLEITPEY